MIKINFTKYLRDHIWCGWYWNTGHGMLDPGWRRTVNACSKWTFRRWRFY